MMISKVPEGYRFTSSVEFTAADLAWFRKPVGR
jgi:hypothetical protein